MIQTIHRGASKFTSDPKFHTERIRGELEQLARHIRSDVKTVTEARAKALFETTAEVLLGLAHAFEHYEAGEERAFRRSN